MTVSIVQVGSYERTSPRQRLAVHHTAISQTEFNNTAELLTAQLLGGEHVTDRKAQRTKQDVQQGKNRCCRTILTILFARIAVGEKLSTVIEFIDTLRAAVVARYPKQHLRDLKTVGQLETDLESAMNPLQWAINSGDASTPMLIQFLRLAKRYRDVLDEMIACIEEKLLPKAPMTMAFPVVVAGWGERGEVAAILGAIALGWWIIRDERRTNRAIQSEAERFDNDANALCCNWPANRLSYRSRQCS